MILTIAPMHPYAYIGMKVADQMLYLTESNITMPAFTQKQTKHYISENEINAAIRIAAQLMGTTEEMVKSNNRRIENVRARWLVMKLMHDVYRRSLKETGRVFGRDHSTVIYALEEVNAYIETKQLDMHLLWPRFLEKYSSQKTITN